MGFLEYLGKLDVSSASMEKEKNDLLDIMANLSAIAEQNSSSTEEVASSIQEQTSIIIEFKESIETLVTLSDNMKTNVEKFKY